MTISGMQSKIKKTALTTGSVIFWILFWQIGAYLANKRLIIKIPYPIEAVKSFINCLGEADFWKIVFVSLFQILVGFVIGAFLGTVLGMLSGKFNAFRIFTAPALHLVRTVPVAALIIVAWLWIPSYALPSFISFLMVLPIVWSHTVTGLNSVDYKLVEMAKVFGMSEKDIALKIKLPMISPSIRNGCLTAVGIAWKSGVAAQVIASPSGTLGAMLSSAKVSIDYSEVFAVTLAIVLLSYFVENILKLIWKEQKK
ncbi:MAG: ABC transporter permease subunit [Eubacterium sp.]|nr:ABC transporter permease subunit [Eubacterium sp.]